jgi:alpha-mannosidase
MSGAFPALSWAGPGSRLNWEIDLTLRPGKPRLDVEVRIDWVGEASRVRLRLPTNIDSAEGIYEIPFGLVRRKPYGVRDTCRGQWPAHRFVAIEDESGGIAVANAGTIGAEVLGGTVWYTLFRAPSADWFGLQRDETSSQHGRHAYRFSVVPYSGALEDSPVFAAAQELNNPLLARAADGGGAAEQGRSLMALSPSTCLLSAVKGPEDGCPNEMIVRLYESAGRQTTAVLTVAGLQAAWRSDLREAKGEPLACRGEALELVLGPFEICTVRVDRS